MFDKDAIRELCAAEAISAAHMAINAALSGTTDESPTDGLAALPSDFTVHDLERHLPARRRLRGSMTTAVLADFADYAKRNAEAGATVFVNQDDMAAVAALNLGTPDAPGHADNTANMAPKRTAAYLALQSISTGNARQQRDVAEFLEDWPSEIECFNDAGKILPGQAIAAIRNISIESAKKVNAAEQQLSASRSAFESVSATSVDPIPTTIYFKCVPYVGLSERLFVLRLGILTTDKPAITLRIVKAEQHAEEMAGELAQLVRDAIGEAMPVLVGTYSVKS